jgi:predicted  nucleic acid-binding Zn-ribbon protein
MTQICEFCGNLFTVFDSVKRKYCPHCKKNGKRYSTQFKERRANDPALNLHAAMYSKQHNLYSQKKISKEELDEWRRQSNLKRHEVLAGDLLLADYEAWCNEAYNCVRDRTVISLYHIITREQSNSRTSLRVPCSL